MLSDTYHEEISKILNWALLYNNSGFEEFELTIHLWTRKPEDFKTDLENYATER